MVNTASSRHSAAEKGPPLGHVSLIPPAVGPTPSVLEEGWLDCYWWLPLADLSDAVGRLYTMEQAIRPLSAAMPRLVGVAVTVKAPPGDNWTIHAGLSRVFPGAALVVDWRGHTDSCGAGEKALVPAIGRGLAGVVIDGAWRDIDDIAERGFSVCGRATSSYSPGKRELGEINVPVACGGVVVVPGDLVVADHDGAVVVPRRYVRDIGAALESTHSSSAASPGADEHAVRRISEAYEQAFEAHGGVYETGGEAG